MALRSFLAGDVAKRTLTGTILPAALAALVIPLFIANLGFPTVYDWRYVVISALLDEGDNPGWYLLPSIGMLVAGVLLVPAVGYFNKRLGTICKGPTRVGSFFMILALIGLISVGTVAQVVHVNKLHEYLAAVAFVGLLFSAFFHGMPILKDITKGKRQFPAKPLVLAWGLLWFALVGLAGSAIYIEVAGDSSWGWVGLDWLANGVPVILSFALWEWVLLAAILVYLVVLAAVTPAEMAA